MVIRSAGDGSTGEAQTKRTPGASSERNPRHRELSFLQDWLSHTFQQARIGYVTMTEEPWPYNLPIFRRSHCAQSPDGHRMARVDPAIEKGMSNPTSGTLCVTGDPHIEDCNPSFIWSDDSRYLVVPQFHGFFGRQRILIVAFESKRIYVSNQREWYFQPESFSQGQLVVRICPAFKSTRLMNFKIPSDLSTQFSALSRVWPLQA